jgi:UDP-N-acetylmuramate--alanine ligase
MINKETDLNKMHFHMLGVGGMGMAPLAIFLKQAGCRVTGDDDNFHPRVHQLLLSNGIELSHKVDYQAIDGVIYSNALGGGHPSLKTAVSNGVKIMRRGEFLAKLSKRFRTVAVAGSHGKSTTCAMLIHALKHSDFPCNYILGGLFSADVQLPAHHSKESPWLVIEVDESDGSIKSFKPTVSLLVNVDWDHADFYETKKKCISTFQKIINRTKLAVFINKECQNSRDFSFEKTKALVHNFGEGGETRLLEFKAGSMVLGGSFPKRSVAVPFKEPFNVQNALAALSVVHFLTSDISSDCLKTFPGLWRRQEILYEAGDFMVLEDYGHHPTEIDKLFEAMQLREGPIIVVFQPHRFSRTLQFKYEFAEVLSQVDQLIVMEVYGAGEAPIMGGTGTDLFEVYSEIAPHRESFFCEDGLAVLKRLKIINPRKGLLLFLGAGNIHDVAATYVATIESAAKSLISGFFNSATLRISEGTVLRENEPLAQKTTLRVGGDAEFYAEPANETDLQILLREAAKFSLQVNFLGRGSNLIVPDSGVRGLVIRLSQPFFQQIELMQDGRVRAAAGVRLKELCGFMRKNAVAGFEFLEGIPGNVGGALRMNAGAMGGWMSDVVSEVVLMNYHGDVFTLPVEELHFGYRHCRELLDTIGLAVIFQSGNVSSLESIQHTMDAYQTSRKESQPRQPSAGCSFKNPEGSAAGMLIDQSGLKGLRVGGAEVSDVHANFIINRGDATASDVISLINELRNQVYQKKGYVLEPEVILFGDSWKDYLIPLTKEPCTSQSVSPG